MNWGLLLFLLSIFFVIYVLVIYPVLLALYARFFPTTIIKESNNSVPLSVIIPVRNGAAWIIPKLESLLASEYPSELIEILVASDGSTDATNELVTQFGDPRVHLLVLPPSGKAVAVSRALEHSKNDIVVLTDVRQAFDRQALAHLVACFKDPGVGVVTGELVIKQGNSAEEYNTGLYWRYEKWIRHNLNQINCMLGATGAIYAIRRELAVPVPPEILLDDVYLPFAAVFRGSRIFFEETAKAYDFPTSLHSEFRRKVRTQAGVYQIMRKFPGLLWPRNPRFIHFISHKIGRLFLPFAMLLALCSSFFIQSPWREIVLVLQAMFYSAGVVDLIIPEGAKLKRFTAVIRAFLVLVSAALCAVAVFFLPAQKLWKESTVRTTSEPVIKSKIS